VPPRAWRGLCRALGQGGEEQLELIGRDLLALAAVQLPQGLLQPDADRGVRVLEPEQQVEQQVDGLLGLSGAGQLHHVALDRLEVV